MTNGSAPGSTSVFTAIFQFPDGRFLFRVTGVSQPATTAARVSVGLGLPPGHPEGQAELQPLFSCGPKPILLSMFPDFSVNRLLMWEFRCPRAGALGAAAFPHLSPCNELGEAVPHGGRRHQPLGKVVG